MRNLYVFGMIALLTIPALGTAHGPSRLKVIKEIEINASPEKVWAVISDFCAIETWHPAVEKCETNGNNEKGTARVLTLGNGESFTEELLKYSADEMLYGYRISKANHKAVPVGTYGSTIDVNDGENGGSKLVWKGFFYRAYPNNDPPPELSDTAATEAVTSIYETGMARIKALAEQ